MVDHGGRRPDVIVVGAMKAGTTSLFEWLDGHPQCRLSPVKEPHFFSRDERFAQGVENYLELFADVPADLVTGEASASYGDPRVAATVATRIRDVAPDVRLIYLVRDPVARMKSHYLHEFQRSRERRDFLEAIAEPGNPYVAMSQYADTAAKFLDVFARDQLLVARTEDFSSAGAPGWEQVTHHLGIDVREGRRDRANVSADKVAFSPAVLRLWQSGRLDAVRRLPPPVRRAARRLTGRATRALRTREQLVAQQEVPPTIAEPLLAQWAEVLRHTRR